MKIILAPSKTRNYNINSDGRRETTIPIYEQEADQIVSKIRNYSREHISKIMKIKNDILHRTFEEYKEFDSAEKHYAIYSYTGTVYKEIELENYNEVQLDYLEANVRILSALYGILRPFDGLRYYRLDMTMKVLDTSTYKFWKDKISRDVIVDDPDEIIVNLSSKEFSKMISGQYINIEFKEQIEENKYKSVAVYSKKARGMMANYMVLNCINSISELKKFSLEGYKFNSALSDVSNIVFTR